MNFLWHVSLKENESKIKKGGIKPQKKPAYEGYTGEDVRVNKDSIYAFSSYKSALKFAFKWCWSGEPKMIIIKFSKCGKWFEDSPRLSTHNAFYSKQTIPPNKFISIENVDPKNDR